MRKERTSHVSFENIQLLELLKVRSQQLKNIFHPAPRRPATMKRAEVPAKESTNPVQLVQSVQPAYPVLPGATINVTGKPEVPAKESTKPVQLVRSVQPVQPCKVVKKSVSRKRKIRSYVGPLVKWVGSVPTKLSQ